MKTNTKILTIGLVVIVMAFSCKKDQKKESGQAEPTSMEQQEDGDTPLAFEKADDCEEFIEQYEEWTDEYMSFMEKYKDNPMGAVSSPEYSKMMTKAASWSQNWLSVSASCTVNSSAYQKRFEKISEKVEKKMKELGFSK